MLSSQLPGLDVTWSAQRALTGGADHVLRHLGWGL